MNKKFRQEVHLVDQPKLRAKTCVYKTKEIYKRKRNSKLFENTKQYKRKCF